MKNFFKFLFSALIVLNFGCSDDDELPVDFDDLSVSGVPFASETTNGVITSINKLDPANSSFTKTYQLISTAGGTDITKLEVFVSLSRGSQELVSENLLKTYTLSDFTTGAGYPEVNVTITGLDILSALNIPASNLEGGDVFNYRLALTNSNGTFSDVSANFDNQSADHKFSSTVICVLSEVPAGVWTIDMADSYGDGWQPTTSGGGGPGITVTLSNGTVFEIGLCTPYEPPGYSCVSAASSGTDTITIPAGITSADWQFNGDFWGEMSFNIFAPSGNLVASGSPGTAAGPIALNLCNE